MAGQKLGWFSQAFIWIHHLKKPEVRSHEFKSTKNLQQKLDCTPDDSHQLIFETEWKCRVIHLQPGAEKAKKKTIFHRPIWYRRVEKNIETLWTISKWYEDIPKKTSYIINILDHLGTSWGCLGFSSRHLFELFFDVFLLKNVENMKLCEQSVNHVNRLDSSDLSSSVLTCSASSNWHRCQAGSSRNRMIWMTNDLILDTTIPTLGYFVVV